MRRARRPAPGDRRVEATRRLARLRERKSPRPHEEIGGSYVPASGGGGEEREDVARGRDAAAPTRRRETHRRSATVRRSRRDARDGARYVRVPLRPVAQRVGRREAGVFGDVVLGEILPERRRLPAGRVLDDEGDAVGVDPLPFVARRRGTLDGDAAYLTVRAEREGRGVHGDPFERGETGGARRIAPTGSRETPYAFA